MTWLQDYEAKLSALVQNHGAVASIDPSEIAINYIRGMNTLYANQGIKNRGVTSIGATGSSGHSALGSIFKGTLGGASWLIDKVERPLYAINEAYQTAQENAGQNKPGYWSNPLLDIPHSIKPIGELFRHPVDTGKAFGRGFSGQDKTTGSDIIKTGAPGTGNKTAAGVGFVLDAFGDPINVTRPIKWSKAGIAAGKDLLNPAEKIAADVAVNGTSKIPVGSKSAKEFLDSLDVRETPEAPFTIAEPPPTFGTREFHVSPGGATATRRVLALPGPPTKVIAGRANVGAIHEALSKVPALKYGPKAEIAPTFKTIMEDAPKAAEVTPEPVAQTTARTKGLSSIAARTQAMYQHLLTNPEHANVQVTLGGRQTTTTVAKLQALAKAKPEQAEMVKQVIVNHARKLASMSKEELAQNFPNGLFVKMSGRTGKEAPMSGVSVDALQRLFETGNVSKHGLKRSAVKASGETPAEAALAQHALESTADLETLSLRRLSGEHVLVGDLLKELGVKVNPVGSKAADLLAAINGPAKAAEKVTKTSKPEPPIFKFEEPAKIKKIVALSKEEKQAWIKAHPHLDPIDAQALLRVKTVSGFEKKVAELRAAKSTGGFNSIDDLVTAVGEGRVNNADLQELLKLTGSKTVAGVRQKLNKMVADLAAAEKKMVNVDQVIAPQDITASAAERAASKVVPAEQIVDNVVNHGTDPVLTSSKEVLDPAQGALLRESLFNGVAKNFIDPKNRAKYGFETNRGVKRTMGEYGKGYARHTQSWNSGAQLNAFRSLVSKGVSEHVAKAITASGAKVTGTAGVFARGTAMYDFVMPVLRAQEKILKNEGIPPVLGNGATGPLLSTLDILDSLPKNFVVQTMFDKTAGGKQILFTQFNEIAEELLNHGLGKIDESTMREQIMHILTQPIKSYDKTKPDFFSDFAKQFQKMGTKNPQAAADMLKTAVDTFADALPEVMQRYNANLAQYGLKFGESVPKVSNEVINRVTTMFTDPNYSPGDIVAISTKVDKLAESIAKNFGISDPWTVQAAAQTAAVKLADILPPEVQAEAKAAKEFTAAEMGNVGLAAKEAAMAKVGTRQAASDVSAVDAMLHDVVDLGDKIEAKQWYRLWRGFAPHIGNQDLHPLLVEQRNATQYFATGTARVLSDLSKKFDTDTIKAAFREIQAGTIPAEALVRQAHDELKPVMDRVWDNNEDANWFARNGVTPRDINAKLRKYGIHEQFAMENPMSWKSFDPKDPLDIISKYHAAAQSALAERNVGRLISSEFGSAVAKPGFVKVVGQNSRVAHIIDTSRFYPREIAEQMHVLDEALRVFNNPSETKAWLRKFDAFFHSFKAGLTIYRPGHHMRNVVGDSWFSWIAGVNDPRVYKDALKAMYLNRGRYDDFDSLVALQEMGIDPMKAGEGAIPMRVAGKSVSISHADMYRLAAQHGVLTDYHTIEDISAQASSGVHEFLNKVSPAHGKIHNAAVNFSEAREHAVRLAHFVDVLKKGNFKSMDEAGREAGRVVRKWHPDGSDLGELEKASARRVFLFYSWMRKAIPLVIESAIQHPGKVLAYPKAYYAIAQAQGINLDGFGDPYPPDQLFPEWIRDNIEGPITGSAGSYYAAHPGVPAADIANQFLGSPSGVLHGIGGSLTPFLRVPGEIFSGNSFSTGAPILDKTDYIDQNLPGINTIAQLSNRSVSGLGQPVRSVAKGNEKGGLDGLAFLNWLTGGGTQDISRPNYIKEAQFELRNKGRSK